MEEDGRRANEIFNLSAFVGGFVVLVVITRVLLSRVDSELMLEAKESSPSDIEYLAKLETILSGRFSAPPNPDGSGPTTSDKVESALWAGARGSIASTPIGCIFAGSFSALKVLFFPCLILAPLFDWCTKVGGNAKLEREIRVVKGRISKG